MKALELARVRGRGVWRVVQAIAGRPRGWGHLVLRLDGFDAPGPVAAPTLDLDGWQARIVDRLADGAVPVRVIAAATHPLLVDVARFAARLDCPVTVRTGAEGLDDAVAEGLAAGGVRRVVVVDGTPAAVEALVRARRARRATLDVIVEVPIGADLDGVSTWARAAGADGLRVGPPWSAGPWDEGTRAWLADAAAQVASFRRTDPAVLHEAARMDGAGPGAPRREGHCAVGGLRLEIGPDGSMSACPFQPDGVADGGDPREGLARHREHVHACARVCVHPELAGPAAR